jgi:biopolymer transport protein ExbD
MAVSLKDPQNGGIDELSEINVTPFIDVMLVLLVVFMITAPLLTAGVPVDLPKTQAAQLTGQDEPLVISVDKNGKAFMIPHTVPNSPTKGAVAPMVASNPVPRATSRPARASIRDSAIASRSLMPSDDRSRERLSSPSDASISSATVPLPVHPSAISACAAARLSARISLRTQLCARRRAAASSMPLANQIVHVTSDANASPIITAFTMMSACMNIPHGDKSRGSVDDDAVEAEETGANPD